MDEFAFMPAALGDRTNPRPSEKLMIPSFDVERILRWATAGGDLFDLLQFPSRFARLQRPETDLAHLGRSDDVLHVL